MIAPVFESMATEFPSVSFAKVDVDTNQETAGQCGVRAMPTFQLFVEGNKVAETKGANERSLKVQFCSWMIPATNDFLHHKRCVAAFSVSLENLTIIWFPFGQDMIMAHMDSGPKGFLPCSSPSPSLAATPNAAVKLKIIEKISHFSSQQAAPLQLLPCELLALKVGGTSYRVFCLPRRYVCL
jgi:hypothetical protein